MRSTLPNIWSRRHLLRVLVTSNLKRQGKNSALGYLWWLLDPALMTLVYYVVVAVLFKRGGANQPFILFLTLGLMSWKAFADSLIQSVNAIKGQAAIVKAISFPNAVIPLGFVLSNTVFFCFGLVVAVVLALIFGPKYGCWPNLYYLMLPVVIVLQVLLTVGFALTMTLLGVVFQDTSNIIGHLLRMWYFMSPGLYSIDLVPERFLALYKLNPFAELMTAYRDIIMFGRMPAAYDLGYSLLAGLVSVVIGFWLFRRFEGRLVQKL